MENASKALIIAGAILLSILLISLGIMIFNQAQDTVNNSGMSQAEINSFNNQFLKYEKASQKGSIVKSLINEVIASNADEGHQNANATVEITLCAEGSDEGTTEGETITNSRQISTSRSYRVELGYNNDAGSDGRVNHIYITPL